MEDKEWSWMSTYTYSEGVLLTYTFLFCIIADIAHFKFEGI